MKIKERNKNTNQVTVGFGIALNLVRNSAGSVI
jgi:hypothetical protein